MKDLKLDKKNLVALQDEQLESIVGAEGDINNSCNKKSCGDNNGDTIKAEVDV